MNKDEMNRKLKLYPGVGVVATFKDGYEVCYFYEDFSSDNLGITRAMDQMYSNPNIAKTCFISNELLIKNSQKENNYV